MKAESSIVPSTSSLSFGEALGTPGDLDDDGIPDLCIGGPDAGPSGSATGRIWMSFLNADGSERSTVAIFNGSGGFTGTLDNNDDFGTSIAGLGDLDDDGVEDLAVGARGDDDGGNSRGALWILLLNTNGTVKAHHKISNLAGNFRGRLEDVDGFGIDFANVGDRDGNGVIDLAAATALDETLGATESGAVWLLFLNADGTVKAHDKITQVHGGFTGTLDNRFADSVAFLGDLDDDGQGDLFVGGPVNDNASGVGWILFLEDGIHASAIDFNGNGTNSLCTATTSLPVLGGTWTAQVDTSTHPGATQSYVIGRGAAQDPPLVLAGGQLLIKPNSAFLFVLSQATSGLDVYSTPVPNDAALIGLTIFTQALIFGGGYELCNATDLVLGN